VLPVVFFPGAGGRAGFWRPVADRLADVGSPVVLAWPGFGDVPAAPSIDSLDGLYGWAVTRLPAGSFHLVAQSMGGVLAIRLAIEHPERVATLVLCATSGGVDVTALGGEDWRPAYRAELPDVPDWFARDRTDLTARLSAIRAPTLVLSGDQDPICPPAVAQLLCKRILHVRAEVLHGGAHDFANLHATEVAAAIRRHISDYR
jgi:poly(3-hydroxyoctanoate) depolymerase